MTKTKDYAALVGLAKSAIDNGFSRVGKTLNSSSRCERALMLLSARAVAIGNAIVILVQQELSNEALPLLRSLVEIAARMRWLIAEDREARAGKILKEFSEGSWELLWRDGALGERMKEFGFPPEAADEILGLCAHHLNGSAQGLPWAHVFEDNKHAGLSGEETLRLAAIASAHAVKALDARWPGKFEGAENMWEKAK
jgi:hypothetical protein